MRFFWFSLGLAPWFGLAVAAAPSAVVHDDPAGPLYGHAAFRAEADVDAVAFAPDGSWMLTLDDEHITKWSLPGGERLAVITPPCTDLDYIGDALAVSPDGKRFAVPCDYDSVRIAEVATGKNVLSIAGDAYELIWSSDGATLGVKGDDGVRLIDAQTGKVRKRWAGDYDLTMTNHGSRWAIVGPELHEGGSSDTGYGEDWGVQLVDSTGKKLWSAPAGYGAPVAFSLDGKHVVVEASYSVVRRDVATGRKQLGRQFDDGVYGLAPRKGGYWALVGSRLLRLDPQLEVEAFDEVGFDTLQGTADGSFVAGLGMARVPVWNAGGKALHSDQGLGSSASEVVTSADGQVVVAMTYEGAAVVIDRKAGTVKPLQLGSWPDLLTITRDGTKAAVSVDSRIQVIDLATGSKTAVKGSGDDGVGFLAFSPDGQQLHALFGWDELELATIAVQRAQVTTKRVLGAGDASVATLSEDGSVLIVPMQDGKLRAVSLK